MSNGFSNFPPNVDDGEHWLPSDIFVNEVPSKFTPPHLHHRPPFSCMDDLAPRFAALSLHNHHQKLPKATNFERLKEPVRYRSMNGTGFDMGPSLYGFRTGPFIGGTKPVYDFQLLKPTQAQVQSYVEARARVLQRQQNRLVPNRVLPFQANGFNNTTPKLGLGGGLVRDSGGTGVFHPRIVNSNPNATIDSKKKQSLKNRQPQEVQVSQQMNSMKSVGVGKQEDCCYHLPPEMGLPRDWTY